jgi:hypothetical protein
MHPNQLYLDGQPIGEIKEMNFSDWEVDNTFIKEGTYFIPITNCTCKATIIHGYGLYHFCNMKLPRKRKKKFIGTRSSRRRKRNGINRK